jgi:hypothetical protein
MLQDNCGSVTPVILRSLLPHIRDIGAFSLGLSYSLTSNDIFSFLGELVDLETLELRYHLVCLLLICHNLHIQAQYAVQQLRPPETIPTLPRLRSLTVMHDRLASGKSVRALCTWIRLAISSAPLESLCVSCEPKMNAQETHINFDSLVSYLGQEHASTLRFLYLKQSLVGADSMRHLCENCINLEELSVMTSKNGVVCLCLNAIFSDDHYIYYSGILRNSPRR